MHHIYEYEQSTGVGNFYFFKFPTPVDCSYIDIYGIRRYPYLRVYKGNKIILQRRVQYEKEPKEINSIRNGCG